MHAVPAGGKVQLQTSCSCGILAALHREFNIWSGQDMEGSASAKQGGDCEPFMAQMHA